MTNPFDDLGSDDADGDEPVDEPATADDSSQSETTPSTQARDEKAVSTGPAFEYSDVRQKPLYARGETWDNLEDELGIVVTPELRRMGIRDDETREVHDALLKVALEHIDEVPEQIRKTRRQA
ncbi:hypothetical protein [Natronorubrum sp. A-ect3]|uniref:hypothetical protein n=1 Tax=Natronorubrum sp. A-ect3 TaxID=3242698 RepID=UPI00359D7950